MLLSFSRRQENAFLSLKPPNSTGFREDLAGKNKDALPEIDFWPPVGITLPAGLDNE